jgi:hypothetical protein
MTWSARNSRSSEWCAGWSKLTGHAVTSIRNPDRPPVEASLVAFAAQVTFIKPCKAAEVTADYVWRLSGPQMAPVNSRKKKIFGCIKVPGGWLCT